jgi:hypothetical protein
MVKIGNNMTYNIDGMRKTSDDFKFKLHALEDLCDKGASKLGLYENKLYVSCSWWIIQGVVRYYYGENRSKVVEFIKNTLSDYFIFYHTIMSCINQEPVANICLEAQKLKEENIGLISRWNKGLIILQSKYTSDMTTCELLDGLSTKLSEIIS